MKRTVLFSAYLLFFIGCLALLYFGRAYYLAPLAQKVRHTLHPLLRQSGTWGHLFGIIGSVFMLLLLLYSVRKRFKFARKWGHLNTWLQVHIFLGITGPVLVAFHTVFRLSGLVAISFWSMVLVVVSGVVGKYIYEMIPRSLSGMDLNRIELEAEEIGLTFEMRKILPAHHPLWLHLATLEHYSPKHPLLTTLFLFLEPLKIRFHFARLLKGFDGINRKKRGQLLTMVVKRQMIIRKTKMLHQTMKILHYWHLVHKPFVIIMFFILLIHVYIAVRMGYVWIF